MDKKNGDSEYLKCIEAFSLVTSMAFMAIFDFLLAYYGGNWLDDHLKSGDHTYRTLCICLALVAMFMNYYRLVTLNMHSSKKDSVQHGKKL